MYMIDMLFPVIATFLFSLLFLSWKKDGWLNFTIKAVMFFMVIMGILTTLYKYNVIGG